MKRNKIGRRKPLATMMDWLRLIISAYGDQYRAYVICEGEERNETRENRLAKSPCHHRHGSASVGKIAVGFTIQT